MIKLVVKYLKPIGKTTDLISVRPKFSSPPFLVRKNGRTADVLGCQVETHGNIRQKKIGQRIQAGVGAKIIPAVE